MPDLIDEIRGLASKIEKNRPVVLTEEATKTAFIMPFMQALGYNVFDPSEVTPELNADVGLKKGEKIDYAILRDGKPIMIFECKNHSANLDIEHVSQLYRYFSCTECRIAVLTNGIEYRFFTDLEASNRMDTKPFLVFRLTEFPDSLIGDLKKLTKDAFNLESVLSSANELKYLREMKSLLALQASQPSEEFVRFLATGIGVTRMTPAVKEQFTELARKAINEYVAERLNQKLKSALGTPSVTFETSSPQDEPSRVSDESPEKVITTAEELEGYYIVKAIVREELPPSRVTWRDAQSYFAIFADNNNRKPICRLQLPEGKQWYLYLFDENKKESRHPLGSLDDLYAHTEALKESAARYTTT